MPAAHWFSNLCHLDLDGGLIRHLESKLNTPSHPAGGVSLCLAM